MFFRRADTDFVDRDGNGVADTAPTPDDLVTSTNDVAPPGITTFDTATTDPATKAWDRIVAARADTFG